MVPKMQPCVQSYPWHMSKDPRNTHLSPLAPLCARPPQWIRQALQSPPSSCIHLSETAFADPVQDSGMLSATYILAWHTLGFCDDLEERRWGREVRLKEGRRGLTLRAKRCANWSTLRMPPSGNSLTTIGRTRRHLDRVESSTSVMTVGSLLGNEKLHTSERDLHLLLLHSFCNAMGGTV